MRKKDVLELKRRLKKDECTFTKMVGCYVDGEKNIVLNINETFLNLDDEEYFKYLEIAKKTLSGTLGNNLLELEFPLDEENVGGRQYSLMELKKSRLKDDALLNDFYTKIIESYDYTGNFLILLFYDAYDVMTKTSDNLKLDESEEVYEYILCAICPVSLSKAGLGYFEDDNRIGSRVRDWVVEMPANGFLFPAFTDRSTDVNSILYYTKNPKETHPELMEEALGCSSKQTATEQKEAFTNIICDAIGIDDEKNDALFMEIQENLNNLVDEHKSMSAKDDEPVTLNNDKIQNLLIESGIPEEITSQIEKSYSKEFGDTPPAAEYLLDKKVLAAKEQRKKEEELEKQVRILTRKLEKTEETVSLDSEIDSPLKSDNYAETQSSPNVDYNVSQDDIEDLSIDTSTYNSDNIETNKSAEHNISSDYDIVVKVKPEKLDQVKSQIIDGKKYLVIPVDDDEQANVNGISTMI